VLPTPALPLPGTSAEEAPVKSKEPLIPAPITVGPPEVTPVPPVAPAPVTPATPPDSILPKPVLTPEAPITPGVKSSEMKPDVLPSSVAPVSPVTAPLPTPKEQPAEAVKPAGVIERAPMTSFDVDLYEPRAGDTYESISREYYSDPRFARALTEFNRGQPLPRVRHVEIPPIHILKNRYPQLLGNTSSTPTANAEWQPASATATRPTANFRTTGSSTYVVPQGGMSMPAISRLTLGTDKRWREIYDLNPQFAPDSVPAGAELKLPANAIVSK
jgi:hypothetical protein